MPAQQLRQLRQGQKVSAIWEGRIVDVASDGYITLEGEPGQHITLNPRSTGWKIELVEPDYEEGEPYRDENGEVWIYHAQTVKGQAWTCTGSAGLHEFDEPLRPLVHLVAEGI